MGYLSLACLVGMALSFPQALVPSSDTGIGEETDFEPSNNRRSTADQVPASDHHQVTVTAKFWYVSDFNGDAEFLANRYAEEMNAALARSNIPITYIRWGTVQRLPVAHADIWTGENYRVRHRNFLNSLGDSEEGRQSLKQSADHIVVMNNDPSGPYACAIFSHWSGYNDYYPTISVSINMTGIFVHEAGHCLGAMHDRYTMNEPDDDAYNYGYCLPDSPYATVMSYPYNCPEPERSEILYFSNPDVSYEGIPTGDEQNNNARAITEDRDSTSKYGSNCYDGNPDDSGHMENMCSLTEWSSWSEWTTCCCVEWDDRRSCPTVPSTRDDCVGCISYLYKQQARNKTRACVNILNETVSVSHCPNEDDQGGAAYEKRRCDCSATTTTTTTTTHDYYNNNISSPGYPANYDNNLNEEYEVVVAEGKVIVFQWTDFDIEWDSNCSYDSVTVVEFVRETQRIVQPKACGRRRRSQMTFFMSQTNRVLVQFKTDGSVTKKGFQLQYKEVDLDNIVTSPGYPEHYANNTDTNQVVTVSPGNKISMWLMFMGIEKHDTCRYDYIMVLDEDGTILLDKTCGKLSTPKKIRLSSTNNVTVKFHTDHSVTDKGFVIVWEEITTP